MKNVILLVVLVAIGLFSVPVNSEIEEVAAKKVTICHIPPGNPANTHAITISVNALPAHLAHGDNLGDCETTCTLETDPDCFCEQFPNDPDCER